MMLRLSGACRTTVHFLNTLTRYAGELICPFWGQWVEILQTGNSKNQSRKHLIPACIVHSTYSTSVKTWIQLTALTCTQSFYSFSSRFGDRRSKWKQDARVGGLAADVPHEKEGMCLCKETTQAAHRTEEVRMVDAGMVYGYGR